MSSQEQAVVDLTRDLVECESENPPGNEHTVAEYLRTRLESSSVPFEVTSYEVAPNRPNVVARVGNPAHGSVLLTGHVDVVPANAEDWTGDPYLLREQNGRIVGRGTADMKAALAAKILATESYYDATNDPGEVILGFVVDEENTGMGTRALVDRGVEAYAAIIGEPTELEVCVAQKGVARYNVTVHGESGHSGRPDDAVDAIAGLGQVLARIEAFDDRLRDETAHEFLAPETITVTKVDGGIAPNVVADHATATVDWRILPGTTSAETFDNRLRELLADITVNGQAIEIEFERTVFARAAAVPADHDLVRAILTAADSAGVAADAVGFNAATDARFLVHDAGIPTVLFGPGSIQHDAHTVNESISVRDLLSTVETYQEALERLLS
ncbi:M20 family metallopeptidase [Haladaptatus halobius]|uniref:M20 family metallopeptidase n=1 Tax=Haladaptatus halobius TaxID=2884875 RepID=UPI001D0BB674|nr:M20 family metallopeptidase [Haladaptatus halobius]